MAATLSSSANDVLLAEIVAAHGVRGAVKLRSHAAPAKALFAYGPLHNSKGQEFSGKITGTVGDFLLVEFSHVTDRNIAEALRGEKLFVARSAMPAPPKGQIYLADLMGLEVRDANGAAIGKVIAWHNYGAGDILEINWPPHGDLMVPFKPDVFPKIDIAGGYIVIVPPYGLLEPGEPEPRDDA